MTGKKKAAARRGASDSGKEIILHGFSVPRREENVKEVGYEAAYLSVG